jgi:hypothetical protein
MKQRQPMDLGPTWYEAIATNPDQEGVNNISVFGAISLPASPAIGTKADVRSLGGELLYLDRSAPELMAIVSTDANDTAGGTGAWAVLVTGTGADLCSLPQETVLLTGLTPALTTQAYTRINHMLVVASGTNISNIGSVTATAQVAGTVQNEVPAGINQSQQSNYTVPSDRIAIIRGYFFSVGKGDEAYVALEAGGGVFDIPMAQYGGAYIYESFSATNTMGHIQPGADIKFTATAITNQPHVSVQAQLSILPRPPHYIDTSELQ